MTTYPARTQSSLLALYVDIWLAYLTQEKIQYLQDEFSKVDVWDEGHGLLCQKMKK